MYLEVINRIIGCIKICDPAVGSGHFLVSVFNEIITIKSQLGVLADKKGKRLKNATWLPWIYSSCSSGSLFITGTTLEFESVY